MKIARVLAAMLLISGIAVAQNVKRAEGRRNPGGGLPALKTYLNLTEQQVADIRAVQAATRETVRPLTLEAAEKARALREALKKDPVDAVAVSALRSEIDSLRTRIKAAREDGGKRSRGVLNSTQLGLLADLEKALTLMPAARGAVGLSLIEPPEGMGAQMGPAIRGQRVGASGMRMRPQRRI
jgi:Spy/CpxP family protein refolding chaperone